MTGPIARVVCPHCGGLFARRRDGRTPYRHRCQVGTWAGDGRAHCVQCGAYIARRAVCRKCGNVSDIQLIRE